MTPSEWHKLVVWVSRAKLVDSQETDVFSFSLVCGKVSQRTN